jgi:AraC family transcriptional regulator, transcriptional activator of pobA
MADKKVQRIKTISEYHKLRGLPKPEHPLISLINFEHINYKANAEPTNWVMDFFSIAMKRNFGSQIKYGQQEYDFDEGILFFIAPGQVFSISISKDVVFKPSGWMLLVHPDFLWNTTLAKTIKHYDYFDYAVNEALFLSQKEEATLENVLRNIEQEYHNNIDKFSQELIIAQLELLLKYADRFYHRQFITRKISNHSILNRLEEILSEFFSKGSLLKTGLPSVQFVADKLNVSPNYLSGVLKTLTGQSTQQHIHEKLIERAKEKLSTTDLSISEIAYELGFEHSQSFSKLFKTKTNFSPLEFRQTFN